MASRHPHPLTPAPAYGLRASERGQWQPAQVLLCEMRGAKLKPTIRHGTHTSAWEKGQWLPALALLGEILGVKLELSIRCSI